MARYNWLVVGFKVNCLLVGPGTIGGMPSMGVFLRDPSPHLCKFWRKPLKTSNGLVDKRDRGLNLALPSPNLEGSATRPLVGP